MYDYVKFRMECPNCNRLVDDFQSKDRERILNTLEFWEVNTFYSSCKNCGTWIEFNRIMKPCSIDEYKMTVKSKTIQAEKIEE